MLQDTKNKEINSMEKQDLEVVMEVKDLFFTYPEAPEPTLKKNNLKIYKNKITSLIGPSGCGKSTLLRAMNRIHDLYPGFKYEGNIDLLNPETNQMENILDLQKENELIGLRQRVGMIFQKPTPFPMSIYDNVAYGLKLSGIKNKSDSPQQKTILLIESIHERYQIKKDISPLIFLQNKKNWALTLNLHSFSNYGDNILN